MTKDKKSSNPNLKAHSNAMLRQHKMLQFAWKWIRIHRPDIEEIIRAEAEKIYPKKNMEPKNVPDSIRRSS